MIEGKIEGMPRVGSISVRQADFHMFRAGKLSFQWKVFLGSDAVEVVVLSL